MDKILQKYLSALSPERIKLVKTMAILSDKVSVKTNMLHTIWSFSTNLDDKGLVTIRIKQNSISALNLIAAMVGNNWPGLFLKGQKLEEVCEKILNEAVEKKKGG